MKELVFKDEWDCITREGRKDFIKELNQYADNLPEFYKRAAEQEKEYLELNREYIIEHRKRFDKALLFDFNDNDFSSIVEDMMTGNFTHNIDSILNWVDVYVNDNAIEASLNREFDKDALLAKMKYWFVSQYMCDSVTDWSSGYEYDIEALDAAYKDAKKYADCLFESADLFTGTNEEINQLIKERYGDDDWFNGEVFILRIIDNKVTYTV